ncbi:MAG: hypothetical protein JXB14_07120 [Candidatus Altiarchaeota archaeon]|nr:hypothetical protein [Candidatus Altiarchaeota archaeon]
MELINSREDFHRVLGETISIVQQFNSETPGFPPFVEILRELELMAGWTKNGRTPTKKERESIYVGLIAVRELDTDPDPGIQDLCNRLHELNAYFEDWPEDDTAVKV